MHLREALVAALHSMRSAPLRTVLTSFGIVLGIAAVVSLIGFTTGLRNGFNSTFGDLSRAVFITKSAPHVPGTTAVPIKESDARALEDQARTPDIQPGTVTPLRTGSAVIRHGDRQIRANAGGTSPAYVVVRNRTLSAGRMFTEQEDADRARVIVLGPDVSTALFPDGPQSAIDQQVVVGRIALKVVGVMTPVSQDQNLLCVTPMSTGRVIFAGSDWLNGIGFMAVSTDRVAAAVTQANQVLDPLHRITSPGARDYTAQTNLEQIRRVDTYLDLIKWFTLAVAGIALFIGGIGVANIMVVTVTERTNEIGIRKAIGARRGSILRQFLVEAIALAGLGGVVGVLAGVGLVQLGARLLPVYAPGYGTPELSWPALAVAFAVSLLIGLGAGGLPAYRAARMRPIEALRY